MPKILLFLCMKKGINPVLFLLVFSLVSQSALNSEESDFGLAFSIDAKPLEGVVHVHSEKVSDGFIFSPEIENRSNQEIHLKEIHAVATLGFKIPKNSRYMVGSHIMASEISTPLFMQQYESGSESDRVSSFMYLLIRMSENDYRLFGLLSWNIFLTELYIENGEIHLLADGENRAVQVGKSIPFEKTVYLQSQDWQDLLLRYSRLLAEKHNVSFLDENWIGWGTWDYYTKYFGYEDILDNIEGAKSFNHEFGDWIELIQVDGSWWVERGDYFETNDRFPPMKTVMDKIASEGFRKGIHFDGFRASSHSMIFQKHPEYFVKNDEDESIRYFDYSHPGARDYIKEVISNAKSNWGAEYFKIDFMTQGMLPKGETRLPVTRLERFRLGLSAMREAMGDSYFLACNALFGSVLGYVDGCRVSKDIKPQYDRTLENVVQSSSTWFTHSILFENDVDYYIIRSSEDEDHSISKSPGKHSTMDYRQNKLWSDFIVITGGSRINSDKIPTLKQEKLQMMSNAFSQPFFDSFIPIDFWDKFRTKTDAPQVFLAKTDEEQIAIGLFNWTDKEDTIQLLGFSSGDIFLNMEHGEEMTLENELFELELFGYQSAIFFYEGAISFEELRRNLRRKE